MKTATLKVEPSPADLLATARQQRDKARQSIDASAAKAQRVGTLHARLEAAKQALAALTQQHAQAVQEWAAAGASGQPPQPDATALQAAHAELAAAQQQADAAGVAMRQVEAEHASAVAAWQSVQQALVDAAVPVALAEIHAARAARQKALEAWIAADAKCEMLALTIIQQQQASEAAREAARELERLNKEDARAGRKDQDNLTIAARDSALRYWNALVA